MSFRMAVLIAATLLAAGVAAAQTHVPDLESPRFLKRVEPVYSADALSVVYGGGTIYLFVEVNRMGELLSVSVTGPWTACRFPDARLDKLRAAAVDAAVASVYLPATSDGIPVDGPLIIKYEIPHKQDPPAAAVIETPKPPPSADGPKVGGVVNGHAVSLSKPVYPVLARRYRISDAVAVRVVIDEEGNVLTAEPQSGHPLLMAASADAACKAKFSPTLLSGQPVKVSGVITYNFVP